MRRREFIKTTGMAATGLSVLPFLSGCETTSKKTNIIFIICDDLNDSINGMGGHPQAQTPNIDRLMKRGVQFTHAYSNDPLCGPSRASLLTGLYPHTTGFYSDKNNWRHMRSCPAISTAQTFMEHFWNNGYDVFGTGKIYHNLDHEDHVWKKQDGTPAYGEPIDWGPWTWDGKNRSGFGGPLHPSLPMTMRVDNMFASLADIPEIPADPEKGIPGYKGWTLHNKPFRYVNEEDRDLMPDELNAEFAVDQLRQKHNNPFLLCVGFNRPHTPLIVPQKYMDMFPLDEVELTVTKENDIADCAKILTSDPETCKGSWGFDNYNGVINGGGKQLLRRWTQAYLAAVSFVDDQVGKILDAYEKSPDKDNTYIVFTSDHGYHMGEKQTLYKLTLWEEAGRVPFIVAGPGIAGGKSCDKPVSLIDIYPTLVAMAGIPSNPNQNTNKLPLDGYSIMPLLHHPEKGRWKGPEVALTVVANNIKHPAKDEIVPGRHHYAVRSRQYRYLLCNNGEEELYDHKNDPYEWDNLAKDQRYMKVKADLRQQLYKLTGRN